MSEETFAPTSIDFDEYGSGLVTDIDEPVDSHDGDSTRLVSDVGQFSVGQRLWPIVSFAPIQGGANLVARVVARKTLDEGDVSTIGITLQSTFLGGVLTSQTFELTSSYQVFEVAYEENFGTLSSPTLYIRCTTSTNLNILYLTAAELVVTSAPDYWVLPRRRFPNGRVIKEPRFEYLW